MLVAPLIRKYTPLKKQAPTQLFKSPTIPTKLLRQQQQIPSLQQWCFIHQGSDKRLPGEGDLLRDSVKCNCKKWTKIV